MRKMICLLALVVILAFAGTALADGAATYKEKCGICHGETGQGELGLAPAHKGNKFLIESKPEDIKMLVRRGRAGAAKKYKQFPLDMPKQSNADISDADLDDLVKFEQGDLQK